MMPDVIRGVRFNFNGCVWMRVTHSLYLNLTTGLGVRCYH